MLVVPLNELGRSSMRGMQALTKRQHREFLRRTSRFSEQINPATATGFGAKRMVDFDAVCHCTAETVRMIDDQQFWAFQRLYHRLRRRQGVVVAPPPGGPGTSQQGVPPAPVVEVPPRKLEQAVRAVTGSALCEHLFYHLYSKAMVRTPAKEPPKAGEEETPFGTQIVARAEVKSTFNPLVFGSLLLEANLDLGRLVCIYKVLPFMYRFLQRLSQGMGTGGFVAGATKKKGRRR